MSVSYNGTCNAGQVVNFLGLICSHPQDGSLSGSIMKELNWF